MARHLKTGRMPEQRSADAKKVRDIHVLATVGRDRCRVEEASLAGGSVGATQRYAKSRQCRYHGRR